jgi:hypothetical protein
MEQPGDTGQAYQYIFKQTRLFYDQVVEIYQGTNVSLGHTPLWPYPFPSPPQYFYLSLKPDVQMERPLY